MTPSKNLRLTLKANATFSALCGLLILLFYNKLAAFMQVSATSILIVIGVGLLLFETFLWWVATRPHINRTLVKSIIIQDWLWVIGTVIICVFQAFGISTGGYWLMVAIGGLVGTFAILQSMFLRRLNKPV
ncbi:MAG: hypothetical protein DHS20C18_52980 [Saprospiraceae bacterium]|nr:MAG: hypothetical protein DHS20C18_52980 [Saprospiraceae bacterium]